MAAAPTATAERGAKTMSDEQTALEKPAAKTPAVITTPDEYHRSLQFWQSQNYNVMSPFTNISGLAPSHGIIVSVVKLDPNPANGDVYEGLPFLKNGEVAPAKLGLRKLAECGGISTRTERLDPCTIPHYWSFRAIASYRGVDGAVVVREATVEWDLRDTSDRLKGWNTAGQVSEGRKNGLRNCEARAINAAIRECGCGIKQKYTKAELAKPFVVLRVMFQPDMTDPDIKRMVTEQALGGTRALYPAAAREVAGPPIVSDEDAPGSEPRHVGRGSTSAPAPATPDPDAPPTAYAVRIVKIEEKTGVKNDRPWTKWTIVDSSGSEATTFSRSVRDIAEAFMKERTWAEVAVETSDDGKYRNIIEIVRAGSEPSLPGLDKL